MVTVAEFNRSQAAKRLSGGGNQSGSKPQSFASPQDLMGQGIIRPAATTLRFSNEDIGRDAAIAAASGGRPAEDTLSNREFNEALEVAQKAREAGRGTNILSALQKAELDKRKQKKSNKFTQEISDFVSDFAKTGGLTGMALKGTAAGLDTLFQKLLRTKPTPELLNDPRTLAVLNREFAKDTTGQLKQAYKDLYKDVIEEAYENDISDRSDSFDFFDDRLEDASRMSEEGILGKGSQRINFPTEFYKDFQPQTSGDLVNLASLDISANPQLADRILAARAELNRMGKNPFTGTSNQGIMAASPALPGLPVTRPPSQPISPIPADPPIPAPVPSTGIMPQPFNIQKFYASLPQYTQQGIMSPNLAQYYQNLGLFPGMNV